MSDNVISADRLLTKEKLHKKIVMNENSIEMNVNDSNVSGRVQSHFLEMNVNPSHTADINSSDEYMQPTTNGNTLNKLPIDKHGFLIWYLKELQSQVKNVATGLLQEPISAEHQKFMHAYLGNPQLLSSQEGIGMFLSILQGGQQKLERINQESTMYRLGELDVTFGERISEPADENGDHMNAQIQAPTQSNTPVSHIPNNNSSSTSPLNLSQLLLQKLEIIKGEMLFNLKLIHPPKQFWHPRTINCLAKNDCPPIQSEVERKYIVLELPGLSNYDKNIFFAHVQLLTHDNKIHPSKFIVPPKTIVQDQIHEFLTINDAYGCDLNNKTILYPLTTVKCDNCQITLQIIMLNAYKKKRISRSNRARRSIHNNNIDQNDLNDFIEDELHKICKLRFQICRLTNTGQLEYVSEYIDTNLIKESKGTEELETIDPSQITPQEPCDCGDEETTVPLNTNSEKAGFVLKINGRQLALHEFVGVIRNTIKIYPPRKTPEANDFHLTIAKRNVLRTIMENFNPYEYLIEETLLNTRIKYTNHNGNCHQKFQSKKQRKK